MIILIIILGLLRHSLPILKYIKLIYIYIKITLLFGLDIIKLSLINSILGLSMSQSSSVRVTDI